MRSARITLDEYSALCEISDISPNYHPSFVEHYFSRLGLPPRIIGRFDTDGRLVAAFPAYAMQVFPNSVHKILLGRRFRKLGEIGQPESLFPVLDIDSKVTLNRVSPTTSPLLATKVRRIGRRSLKSVAIARERRHKKLTIRQRAFFEAGGRAHFSSELGRREFADIYIRLHGERWGYAVDDLQAVREQIERLYEHVFGLVLELRNEPVAAQLCFCAVGKSLYYVDFINSGVKLQKDNVVSHGSVMMLTSLRRAEELARDAGRPLRFSFGYYYGDHTYKAVWAQPEPTFVGF